MPCSDYSSSRASCLLDSGNLDCGWCSAGCCLATDNSTSSGDACTCPNNTWVWLGWLIGAILIVGCCSCIGYAIYYFFCRQPPVADPPTATQQPRQLVLIMTADGQVQQFDPNNPQMIMMINNLSQQQQQQEGVEIQEGTVVQGSPVFVQQQGGQEMQTISTQQQQHPAAYGQVIPGFAPPVPINQRQQP